MNEHRVYAATPHAATCCHMAQLIMSVEEPEPSPRCADDLVPLGQEPCLIDTLLAQRLVVQAPARAYIVWRTPDAAGGEFRWTGLHLGENSWIGIQSRLGLGHYQSGDRLRRLVVAPGQDLIAAGRALFRAEAARHGADSRRFRIRVSPCEEPAP
eukprot:4635210-Amphidinium_carterae.1